MLSRSPRVYSGCVGVRRTRSQTDRAWRDFFLLVRSRENDWKAWKKMMDVSLIFWAKFQVAWCSKLFIASLVSRFVLRWGNSGCALLRRRLSQYPLLGRTGSRGRCWAAIRLSHHPKSSDRAVHGDVDGLDIEGRHGRRFVLLRHIHKPQKGPIPWATIPSIFLRFVLILQYYVLENNNVHISKKSAYLWLGSLFFLIFCSITILNKQYLLDIQTISISSQIFCNKSFFM